MTLVHPGSDEKTQSGLGDSERILDELQILKVRWVNVCRAVSLGTPLPKVCERPGMPDLQLALSWMIEYPELALAYQIAIQARAQVLAEEAISVVDEVTNGADANLAKVRSDVRRWLAGALDPQRFGNAKAISNEAKSFSISWEG